MAELALDRLDAGPLHALGSDPATCALVGDSISDIRAAQAAATASIGYANKPGKHQCLQRAGADAIVTTVAELHDAPLAHQHRPEGGLGRAASSSRGGGLVLPPRPGWRDLAGRCWHARPQPQALHQPTRLLSRPRPAS